ncbi:FlgD immunoglobulin-like domain containing protein [bacterium]
MFKISFSKSIDKGVKFFIPLLFLSTGIAFSQSSENYTIKKSVIDQAGSPSSSAGYSVRDAVGQPSDVGNMSSTNYSLSSGFLSGREMETAVDDEQEIDPSLPRKFQLKQNYPNPFNPVTTMTYQLPHTAKVSLMILSMQGRMIRKWIPGQQQAGVYSIQWNGRDQSGKPVPSGVYLYQIEVKGGSSKNSFLDVKKLILIK